MSIECKMIELMDLIGGGTPKTSKAEYWNGDIPWLSVKDFNGDGRYVYTTDKAITQLGLDNSSTRILNAGDIIISARGTVGELAIIPFPMAFNQSCYGIRAKQDIVDSMYLYYLMKYNVRILQCNTHGSVFDTITRDTFANIDVSIPNIDSQRTVATLLSLLDEQIELNNKINENLEQQAVTLFRALFTDFGENKSELVSSPFGNIPSNFNIIKNGEVPMTVTDYVANGSFASLKENVTLYQERNYAYFIRNTDLKSGNFEVFVDKHSYDFLSKSTLYGGEIIISNVGDVGSVFLCPKLDQPMTLGNNIIMLRPEQNEIKYYLYVWFKWLQGQALIQRIKGGSAQPKFNKTDFKNLPLMLPTHDLIFKYNETVSPMFETINNNERENKYLSNFRDALLPKLMSSEFDVSNVTI